MSRPLRALREGGKGSHKGKKLLFLKIKKIPMAIKLEGGGSRP